MAAAITISAADLQAIQRVAAAPGHGDGGSSGDLSEAALRASRAAASAARAAQWPNTLAGLRRRKDAARSEAAAAREAEAVALDAVMAEERLGERLAILRAANAYFAGQSDKVKALRSYQQRQMDLESNQANAAVRARRAAGEAAAVAEHHSALMAGVAAGEAEEAARRASARERARGVAEGLTAQVRAAYAARAEAGRAEAQRAQEVLADARLQEEEAAAAAAARVRAASEATHAFARDNARLAASRADAGRAEAAVDARVQAEVQRQEAKAATIAGVLAAQKEEAQRKAKVISDLVRAAVFFWRAPRRTLFLLGPLGAPPPRLTPLSTTRTPPPLPRAQMAKDYLSRQSTEDARVSAQVAEAEAKTEAAAAAKRAGAEAMKRSITAHITSQRLRAVAAQRAEVAEARADHAVFGERLGQLDAQAARDAAGARARAEDTRRAQLAQMADKKRTLESWRAVDATDALAADGAARGGPLDALFNDEARALVEREASARGARAAQPVLRLVHKLQNPALIPNLRRM